MFHRFVSLVFLVGIPTSILEAQSSPLMTRGMASGDGTCFFDPWSGEKTSYSSLIFNPLPSDYIVTMMGNTVREPRAVVLGGGANHEEVQVFDIAASPPELLAGFQLGSPPVDVAVAPRGPWWSQFQPPNLAVVRTSGAGSDAITFLDPMTATLVASYPASTGSAFGSNAIAIGKDYYAYVLGGVGPDSVHVYWVGWGGPFPVASFGLSTAPHDVDVTPDGRYAVVRAGSTGPSGDAITFFRDGQFVTAFSNASHNPLANNSIAFSRDSTRAVVTGGGGAEAVKVFGVNESGVFPIGSIALSTAPWDVEVSPQGRICCVRGGASNDAIAFLDTRSGSLLATFGASRGPLTRGDSIVFSTDASRAIVIEGTSGDSVAVFDVARTIPAMIGRVNLPSSPVDLDMTRDGRFAVVRCGAGDQAIVFINPTSGSVVATFPASTVNPLGTDSIAIDATSDRALVSGGASSDAVQLFDLSGPIPTLIATRLVDSAPMEAEAALCETPSWSGEMDVCSGPNGWPGTNGIPRLRLERPPVLGTTTTLVIENSLGVSTTGFLFIGKPLCWQTPWGGTLGIDLSTAQILTISIPGGGLRVPFPVPEGESVWCGWRTLLQVLEVDPGASAGMAFTPVLEVIMGSPRSSGGAGVGPF